MDITLASKRLALRPHAINNLDRLHLWKNDAEIVQMSSDEPHSETIEQTCASLKRWMSSEAMEVVHLAIHQKPHDAFIGFAHLAHIDRHNERCKLGIVIGEKTLWGNGYGTEAVRILIHFAFGTLSLRRISCETYEFNGRSIRMLERVGFSREGILRQSIRYEQGFADEHCYGLLREEWNGGHP